MGLFSKITGALSAFDPTGIAGSLARNKEAEAAARTQMEFQKWMYQNRYRMQVADMRASGLNPILSYRQAPPGVPSGSTYNPENVAGASAQSSSARATAGLRRKQVEQVSSQINVNQAQAVQLQSSARALAAQTRNQDATAALRMSEAERTRLQSAILAEDIAGASSRATSARHRESLMESEYGPFLRFLETASGIIRGTDRRD